MAAQKPAPRERSRGYGLVLRRMAQARAIDGETQRDPQHLRRAVRGWIESVLEKTYQR